MQIQVFLNQNYNHVSISEFIYKFNRDEQLRRIQKRKFIPIFNPIAVMKNIGTEKADGIMEDIYLTREEKKIAINKSDIWKKSNFKSKDRSTPYKFHCLYMLFDLSNAYEQTGKTEYLKKGEEILLNWKKYYLDSGRKGFAWHDHATALRLISISQFFESWKKECWDLEKAETIINMVEVHCEKLSDDEFYMEKHNHGFDQDLGLFIGAYVFDILDKSDEYIQKASKRLLVQVNYLFNKDGSFKEHSPNYGALFSTRMLQFINFCDENNIQNEYIDCMKKILSKSVEFLKELSYENGTIVNISDGEILRLREYFMKNLVNDKTKTFETTMSIIDEKQRKQDRIFPYGGYATLNGSGDQKMIFYSGFHSRVHKHHDDLSVVLYGCGQQILTDGGKYNYNYKDRERKYVVSNLAHNTVCVDKKNSDIKRLNIEKSGLREYYFGEKISLVTGIHGLYEDVIHRRIVIKLDDKGYVILDKLKGIDSHNYQCVFNLHPSIGEAITIDGNVEATLNEGNKFRVIDLLKDSNAEIYRGEKKPMRGWYSPRYGKLVSCNQISFEKNGEECRFATLLTLDESCSLDGHFAWTDDEVEMEFKQKKIKIILDDFDTMLYIDENQKELLKVKNNILDEHLNKYSEKELKNH